MFILRKSFVDLGYSKIVFLFCLCNISIDVRDYSNNLSANVKRSYLNLPSNINPTGIYLPKINNRNTRTGCEICSKLTIKIPERRQ